ncbi:hypothetical protein CTRI78_v010402 [Colletotrichum trifolii]|uniref:Uncharacterized protein n=1 Tax=Colletotrichum trifolii TaxID=5466 RepID=A0A4R8QY28_COLTR|nr:hypothetical protein CTRI78_v010402 [Colletotrichum trifolii]
MWRLLRPRASNIAARALAPKAPGQQTVVIQRVKVSKVKFNAKSFIIGAGTSIICWNLYWSTVLNPFLRHVDKEYDSLSAAEKKALDEEMDEEEIEPWFIPFPFTTKRVTQPPYKATDPEWQQFVRISKDKKLQQQMRSDLADWVRVSIEAHPGIATRCGNAGKLRRYWLDIDFPYRPPPVHYSSGLLLEDDGLYWSNQPVDSLAVDRLRKILWPEAMTLSTWAFVSALARQHLADLSRMLGFETSQVALAFPPVGVRKEQSQKTEGPLTSADRQTTNGTPAHDASNVSKTADARQSEAPESGGTTNFVRETAVASVMGMRKVTDVPMYEFRKKLAQTWRPTKGQPPSGCVLVSGFVEIEMPRGYVLVDVWGHWNPKTELFENDSSHMIIRRMQLKKQAPAGR